MFRASLRPSSGGQTAFSLYMVICPVVTCDVGESAGKLCALCGVGRLISSGIDALPSFPGESTVYSSSRFVVQGVFWKTGVVHSFKMIDPVLFLFGSHVLYSRDL